MLTIITNIEELRIVKLNKYFDRDEFACKCGCGFATVDTELLNVITLAREYFKAPITINSGCRCEIHNTAVNGSYRSKHKEGIAADIVVKGVKPNDVYKYFNRHAPSKYGLGNYETFTHVDVRRGYWRG